MVTYTRIMKAGLQTGAKQAATRKAAPPQVRDRAGTRQKILDALGALLARQGFRGVGVNSVAREAGVDKVLLYRYFGGLDGLFSAFAKEFRFFPGPEELSRKERGTPPPASALELGRYLLLAVGRALRQSPMAREILRGELLESNALTDLLAAQRERRAIETLSLFESAEGIDLPALVAVLGAGQTYLALRAKTARVYNGIDIRTEEGWARIEAAINLLLECVDARYQIRAQTGVVQREAAPRKRGPRAGH